MKTILGLPMSTHSPALYLASGIAPLSSRLNVLNIRTIFRIIDSPLAKQFHQLHQLGLGQLDPLWWPSRRKHQWTQYYPDILPYIQGFMRIIVQATSCSFRNTVIRDLLLPRRREIVLNWPAVVARQIALFYDNPLIIATDGAARGPSSACAFTCPLGSGYCRLPNYTLPMFAELCAIDMALDFILINILAFMGQQVVILSDSQSSLAYLVSLSRLVHHGYFWNKIVLIRQTSIVLFLSWIPAHVGVAPNEEADRLAGLGLDLLLDVTVFPCCVGLPEFVCSRIQQMNTMGFRDSLLPVLAPKHRHLLNRIPTFLLQILGSQTLQWFFFRLQVNRPPTRLGSVIFSDARGDCIACSVPLTSEHLLMTCPRFDGRRQQFLSELELYIHVDLINFSSIMSFGTNIRDLNALNTAHVTTAFRGLIAATARL